MLVRSSLMAIAIALVAGGAGAQQQPGPDAGAPAPDKDKPHIVILATGGTIAGAQESQTNYGYTSGTISADGPANLYDAVSVAANSDAAGRGTLVVLNGEIHAARNVAKTNTTSVETFESPNRGPAGLVHTGKVTWLNPVAKRHTTKTEF